MRTILKINLIIFHLEIDITRAIGELRLLLRFNLVFLPLLAVSFCAAGYIFRQQLRRIAEEEVLENARVMMQTARASRVYTTSQIAPLLDHEQSRVYRAIDNVHQVLDEHLPTALQKAIDRLPSQREKQVLQNVRQQILESVRQQPREMPSAEFFPQRIPFYAATEAFNYFRTQYPDYDYKEAALNPMNPRDRTIEWEADIVNLLIKTPGKTEFFGHRETPLGTSLYYSAPIRVHVAVASRATVRRTRLRRRWLNSMGPPMGSAGSSMTSSERKSSAFRRTCRIAPPMPLCNGLSGGWRPYLEFCFFW